MTPALALAPIFLRRFTPPPPPPLHRLRPRSLRPNATHAVERRGAALESRSDQAAVLPVRERVQRLIALAPRLRPAAESKGQPTTAGVAADAAGP
jgi:hypothetical protein